MTPKQIEKLEAVIAKSIEKNVNGKINLLTQKVDAYIESDNQRWAEYEPYIKGLASLSIGGKIVVWCVMAVGTIAGAIVAIKKLFP